MAQQLVTQGKESLKNIEKELNLSRPNSAQVWKQLNELKVCTEEDFLINKLRLSQVLLTKLPSLQCKAEPSTVSNEYV
jgi:hypothetical protein